MAPSEFKHLDQLISQLIKKGQSIYHIYTHHKDEICCSQRTLYNFFENNLFTAKNIDLPRKVRYKKRKKRKVSVPSTQKHSFGRTYEDFLDFTTRFPDVPVVEMDTLKGKIEKGKVLLTLFFRNSSFMIAFILDSCSQKCVKKVFDSLYKRLGHNVFTALFPVILTDNGSEMKAPADIELSDCGRQRTRVFYCHPMNSNQKARLEKNHEYLRYIFPKGTLFEKYSQEDITLAINHINSTARASLKGDCPYRLARLQLDHALFEKLGLNEIPADDVVLKPLLLKK
jgi:IS30 family transposase